MYMYFLGKHPLSRYITTNSYTNLETVLIYQLVAYLGANHQDNITNYLPCDDCYSKFDENDQVGTCTPDIHVHLYRFILYIYSSVPGKCPWVLKHNSRFWPAWVLTRDIHVSCICLYRSC